MSRSARAISTWILVALHLAGLGVVRFVPIDLGLNAGLVACAPVEVKASCCGAVEVGCSDAVPAQAPVGGWLSVPGTAPECPRPCCGVTRGVGPAVLNVVAPRVSLSSKPSPEPGRGPLQNPMALTPTVASGAAWQSRNSVASPASTEARLRRSFLCVWTI